jgi:hypothetical protein
MLSHFNYDEIVSIVIKQDCPFVVFLWLMMQTLYSACCCCDKVCVFVDKPRGGVAVVMQGK